MAQNYSNWHKIIGRYCHKIVEIGTKVDISAKLAKNYRKYAKIAEIGTLIGTDRCQNFTLTTSKPSKEHWEKNKTFE